MNLDDIAKATQFSDSACTCKLCDHRIALECKRCQSFYGFRWNRRIYCKEKCLTINSMKELRLKEIKGDLAFFYYNQ
jgi:hypothetical protein